FDTGILWASLAILFMSILIVTCKKDRKTVHAPGGVPESASDKASAPSAPDASKSASSSKSKKKEKEGKKKESSSKKKEKKKDKEAAEKPKVVTEKPKDPLKTKIPTALISVNQVPAAAEAAQPKTVKTSKPIEQKEEAQGSDPGEGDGAYEDVNLVECQAPETLKGETVTEPLVKTVLTEVKTEPKTEPKPEEHVVDAAGEGEKPIVDAASKDALSLMLKVQPPKATFNPIGGVSNHTVTNSGKTRLVFKIKSSNNNDYGIHPVFGFIEPSSSTVVKVTRLPGNPKEDKMIIQWVEAPGTVKDPKEAFQLASPWLVQSMKVIMEVVAGAPVVPESGAAIQALSPVAKPIAPVVAPPPARSPVPIRAPPTPPGPAPVKPPVPPVAAAPVLSPARSPLPIRAPPTTPGPAPVKPPVPPIAAAPPLSPLKPIVPPPAPKAPLPPISPGSPKPPVPALPPPAFVKGPPPKPFVPGIPAAPVPSKGPPPGLGKPPPPPVISPFPVPKGPPPAPAAGVAGTDGVPVVSVYAAGGNAPFAAATGPKSMAFPGMSAGTPPPPPPKK
ncbi:hypothetical protein V3C99_011554, partial [Haemonchus contortus]